MNLPSVKTLMNIAGMDKDRAKLLRKVLECNTRDEMADIVDSDLERFGKQTGGGATAGTSRAG